MGCRTSGVLKGRAHATVAVAFLAVFLALTFLVASNAQAQETTIEQTTLQADEATTPSTETERTTAQPNETKAGNSAREEHTVAAAQQTPSAEPKQAVQQGGQQAGAGNSSQTVGRATPQGVSAQITESAEDEDNIVDGITLAAEGCEVASNASVVVEDNDGTRVRLTNNQNVTIEPDDQVVRIEGNGTGGNLGGPSGGITSEGGQFGTVGQTVTGEVVSSTGITACDRANGGENNGNTADNNDDDDLNCDQLLRRFRGASGNQYLDVDVTNQILVCLAQEVDQDTEADEDLPDTGGPSLIGFAVLGVVSALVGVSLVRGGRREE